MKPACRSSSTKTIGLVLCSAWLLLAGTVRADDGPQWIWSPEHPAGRVPKSTCCFRKSFMLDKPVSGELKIAADDEYEVFVNSRRVGTGKSTELLDRYDISDYLRPGQNLVAVRVVNARGATAALGAIVNVQDRRERTLTIGSDSSWLTHTSPLPLWHTPLYNDSRWARAQMLGRIGATSPWDDAELLAQPRLADESPLSDAPTVADESRPRAAAPLASGPSPADGQTAEPAAPMLAAPSFPADADSNERPERPVEANRSRTQRRTVTPVRRQASPPANEELAAEEAGAEPATPGSEPQFVVEQVLDAQTTGSLLAMAFNEFGHVLAAREQGGLVLMYDSDQDGVVDQIRVANDELKECRGLLSLNGELFATGQGPDGLALYRLTDGDRDGRFEQIRPILKFDGRSGQYGPHGIALGTDGFLYVAVGCLARPAAKADPVSPYRRVYEGDLVQPRYEDPQSELAQVAAPAGTIIRLTPDGQQLQTIAGGLYDAAGLALSPAGELFVQDSETAADSLTPWFRHAAVYHALPGGEFGWRSGSANWPSYFLDRLPPIAETGRGIVAGMTFYDHDAFPDEYRHALFIANWTLGRITALKLAPDGSSYSTESEVFVDDASLHVTSLAVGPDGGLYFCTGDRGAAGGLYRIRWTGESSANAQDWGSGVRGVIRQPQFEAAWSRQRIASEKSALGAEWVRLLEGVAASPVNPCEHRTRALDLLQLFGPAPTTELLISLARENTPRIRAKAAELMGLRDERPTRDALVALLADQDSTVRRRACEALVRCGGSPSANALNELLKSSDRHAAWSARKLLETIPADQWAERLLASDDLRTVLQAGTALLAVQPNPENGRRVLDRVTKLIANETTDADFLDALRVLQLALLRGEIRPADARASAELLAAEFPAGDRSINNELMRLLTYLRVSSIMDRYFEYLGSAETPDVDKLHVALHLPLLADTWNIGQQIQLIEFLDAAQDISGDSARRYCLAKASRNFAESLSDDQVRTVLSEGDRWPHAAVALLYRLPEHLDAAARQTLIQVDDRLTSRDDDSLRRLKVGIVAVLARSGDADSLAHLRGLWEREPERRPAVAMGLAQWPSGKNWSYLVRSLSFVEADVARELLEKLTQSELAPEDPEHYRQVILRGLELDGRGAAAAIGLLEHWTGIQQTPAGERAAPLAAWQAWFAQTWPDHPSASLPVPREGQVWTPDNAMRELENLSAERPSASSGAAIFESARCAECHRCGERGGGDAPDLTGIGQRLMRKEIVRSVVYPSDMIASARPAEVAHGADGSGPLRRHKTTAGAGKVAFIRSDTVDAAPSSSAAESPRTPRVSDMPEGLLDTLSAAELRDLFAFLLADRTPRLASQDDSSRQPAAGAPSSTDPASPGNANSESTRR